MTSSNRDIFCVTGHLCGEFPGEFPAQGPVMLSFDVFFDLRLNKRLSKQPWGWWFETSWSLWRHYNAIGFLWYIIHESSCWCYLGCFHAGYSTLWKYEFFVEKFSRTTILLTWKWISLIFIFIPKLSSSGAWPDVCNNYPDRIFQLHNFYFLTICAAMCWTEKKVDFTMWVFNYIFITYIIAIFIYSYIYIIHIFLYVSDCQET